jgi:hypothetical protein
MVADRPETGLLLEPPDVSTDRSQRAPGGRSRAGLGQPATRSFKVVARFLGIDQATRHAARSAATSGWRRQFVVSADAVDPGINVIGVDIEAGGEGGIGRCDAFGLPGEARLPFGFGFGMGGLGAVGRKRNGIHAAQCSAGCGQLPVR